MQCLIKKTNKINFDLFYLILFNVIIIGHLNFFKINTIVFGAAFAVILLYFVEIIFKNQSNFNKNFIFIFVIFSFWIFLALIYNSYFAYDQTQHIKYIIVSFLESLSVAILAYKINFKSKLFKNVFFVLITIFILINYALFVLYFTSYLEYPSYVFSGIYGNRNMLAVVSCFLFLISLYNPKNIFIFKINYIFALLLAFLILLSGSTKGIVAIMLILILFFMQAKKKIYISILTFVSAAFFIKFGFAEYAYDRLLGKVGIFFEGIDATSGLERVWLIKESSKLALEHFFTGIGLQNSPNFLVVPFSHLGKYSHVNYLEILLSGGILLFIAYYLPIFFMYFHVFYENIFKSKKNAEEKNEKNMLLSLLTLIIFYDTSMVSYHYFQNVFFLYFCIFLYLKLFYVKKKLHDFLNYNCIHKSLT